MYWQMFYTKETTPHCMRLHLLAEVGDSGFGMAGTSLGFVEQAVATDPWNVGTRSDVTLTAYSNITHIQAEVPDIETGMAIVLMNLQGNQS